ncbi:uncharacterized protein LOC106664841 [Cimex lectularius]|uniref:MD-2-related lipid-recognition domain-containing protein n=1 Tax=Cimex lectularius TaxID=79782 RepID=A0A8I6RLX9_CIMLE|nr:uncharacterized protein LOC106664841 [Cimex lectularius]
MIKEALYVTLFSFWSCTTFAAFAGSYYIIPLALEKCSVSECENPIIVFSNYKIRKLDRSTYVYTGSMNATIPIDDDIWARADVSVWGNGGWKPNFYTFEMGKFCSGMRKFLPKFDEEITMRLNQTCPAPPGFYTLTNLNFRQESQHIPSLPYGKYKAKIIGFDKDKNCVACANFVCEVVPKRRKRP